MIWWVPIVLNGVVIVACPFTMGVLPRLVPPSIKTTLPLGLLPVMLTVSVAEPPTPSGVGDAVTVTVGLVRTCKSMTLDVLGVLFASPLYTAVILVSPGGNVSPMVPTPL